MSPNEDGSSRPSAFTRDEGYTLVEMLVVLALTSVIAAMMASAIIMMRPLKNAERHFVRQRHLQVIAETIARDLEGALPLPLKESSADEPVSMIGGVNNVHFVAIVRTGFRRKGLREVNYRVEKRVDGTSLPIRQIEVRQGQEKETLEFAKQVFFQSLSVKFIDPDIRDQSANAESHLLSLPYVVLISLSGEGGTVRSSAFLGAIR